MKTRQEPQPTPRLATRGGRAYRRIFDGHQPTGRGGSTSGIQPRTPPQASVSPNQAMATSMTRGTRSRTDIHPRFSH